MSVIRPSTLSLLPLGPPVPPGLSSEWSAPALESFGRVQEQAFGVLNELRLTGQLCDAIITVENGQFSVHRAIMATCSPLFRSLFTNGMKETNQREVFIPEISAEMMGQLVAYAYTRQCHVTAVNVEELLPVADYYHVLGVVKACCDFLLTHLTPTNCIGIRNFARHHACNVTAAKAHSYLMKHFYDVTMQGTEYLGLTADELCDVLRDDELNVKGEEDVFETVLAWVEHDTKARSQRFYQLLQCVRLGLMHTVYFVDHVMGHPLVQQCKQCQPLIQQALALLEAYDSNEGHTFDPRNPLSAPRVPHEILLVMGGWSGSSPTYIIETYDTRADKWISIDTDDKSPRAYHGCVSLDGLVYVIGGFDGVEHFSSVRVYNPVTMEWSDASPMYCKRCYVSTCVLAGCIYAMGGFDGHVRHNSAERYTPATNQWSMISSMHQQRSDAKATELGGRIYIAGGFNGQECLNSAEYYEPDANQWTMVAPMLHRRSGVGIVAYDDAIFAVGGFDGLERLCSTERYSVVTNTWTLVADMYNRRSNFAIEIIDDHIFVIGGFNGTTTVANVECYDGSVDEWYECCEMNIFRSALSACVLRELPNMRLYLHPDRWPEKPSSSSSSSSSSPAAAAAAAAKRLLPTSSPAN